MPKKNGKKAKGGSPKEAPENSEVGFTQKPDGSVDELKETSTSPENTAVDFPVIAEGNAAIEDIAVKKASNVVKLVVSTEMATHLSQNKGVWANVEVRIKSNQAAIPIAEVEEAADQGELFDDLPGKEKGESEEGEKEPEGEEL